MRAHALYSGRLLRARDILIELKLRISPPALNNFARASCVTDVCTIYREHQ